MPTRRNIVFNWIRVASLCIAHCALCIGAAFAALPAGYTGYTFIQGNATGPTDSTHAGYILTDIYPNPAADTINAEFDIVDAHQQVLWSARGSSATDRTWALLYSVGSNQKFRFDYWNSYDNSSSATFGTSGSFSVTMANNNCAISKDGGTAATVTYGAQSSFTQTGGPLAFFATHNGTTLQTSSPNYANCKLHSFTITRGGVVVHNLVPAVRDSDSKPGLYDTATGTFHPGTGSFTMGDVVAVDDVLDIVSSPADVGSPSPAYGTTNGLAAGTSFTVSCGTTPAANAAGTVQSTCTGWKLYDTDGNVVSNGTETSFTYTHPDPAAYRKLEWQWSSSVKGVLAAGPGGSVSTSGTAWYSGDTPVTVTATPDSGMDFIRWTGTLPAGIDATSASATFTPAEPFEMTALFGGEHFEAAYAPNGDTVYTFSASGPFTLERPANARLLLVGGGGAGGRDCSGGGGAGGMVEVQEIMLAAGTYTVTVGAGGQPVNNSNVTGGNGGDSALSLGGTALYTAFGGGGGGSWGHTSGASGGSGGGATSNGTGGSGVEGQGYAGGNAGNRAPAGGGGAGGPGSYGSNSNGPGTAGGPGKASDITGVEVYYAGGGGGGGFNSTSTLLNGGIGGGGNGVRNVPVATRKATTLPDGRNEYEAECGVDGLGGGGGGACNSGDFMGRPGGRGVVIIRVQPTPEDALYVSCSAEEEFSSPMPAYGRVTGLAAGEMRAVSCGATPAANAAGTIQYSCTGWKLYDADGNVVSNGTETSFAYTHPDPAAYRRLEWQWESTAVRGVITAGAGGAVSPSGTAWYALGTPVTVTATPNAGKAFFRWMGTALPAGIDVTSATVTFTPAAPFDMTAIFVVATAARAKLPVSGAYFHVDASHVSTLTTAEGDGKAYVTRWNDASGGSVYASATDSARRPFLDIFGGKPVISFGKYRYGSSGSGDAGWMKWSARDTAIREVFMVYSDVDGPVNAFLLGDGSSYDFHREDGGAIFSAKWSSANLRGGLIEVDGESVASTYVLPAGFHIIHLRTTGNVNADQFARDRNGSYANGGQMLGEVVIYNKTLTDDEAASVYDYLKFKWFPVDDVLAVTSSPIGVGSLSPYGTTTGLVADDTVSVSCGTTPWTNATETAVYSCTGWKLYDIDGNVVSNGTETSFTYTHPTPAAFRRLEWQWEATEVKGVVTAGAGGTVSPSGTAWYPLGTPVTVAATADAGKGFVHWTGTLPAGVSADAASATFTSSAPFAMTAVFGADLHVAPPAPDGNGDDETGDGSQAAPFATIARAIAAADAAIAGGIDAAAIRVAAGSYAESGLILTNDISIFGAGADATVVDGNGGYRVFTLRHPRAALRNLTVTNGKFTANSQSGAGVYMEAGLVEDCRITACGNNNYSALKGGGIYASGGRVSRTVFTGCQVRAIDNSDGFGAALYLEGGAICENSLFTNNVAGQINNGKGGTVNLRGEGTALVNCTVVRNQLSGDGRAMAYTGIVQLDSAKVVNCVAYGNGDRRKSTNYRDVNGTADCFVNSAWGIGNDGSLVSSVAVDDLAFADYANGDYRPGSTNLVDAGADLAACAAVGALSATDLDGNARVSGAAPDIGCYEKDLSAVTAFGVAESYGALVASNVTFTATALGGGGSYTYRWDFGDGSVETTADATVRHAYAAGRYPVTVAASDDGGATWGPAAPLAFAIVVAPATMYVDVANESPEFPYDTPAKASTTIAAPLGCLTNVLGEAVVDGATIHVAAGTYNEKQLLLSSAVSVIGAGSATNAADSVILQPANLAGNNTAFAIKLDHDDALLQNVKVRVGAKTYNNNGWNLYLARGTVRGCWIAGNGEAQDNLYMTGGLVEDTKISDGNRVNWENPGEGINVYATGGRIRRCVVTGGTGGNSVHLAGDTVMENTLVTKTTNYRINTTETRPDYVWAWAVKLLGSAKLVNCTVVGNTSFYQASNGGAKTPDTGAVWVGSATAQVVNCVIYGNDCAKTALEWGNANAACFLNCAVPETAAAGLTNETANGNIVIADADFASVAASLYQPSAGSRLIDAGADLAAIGTFSATDLDGNARVSGAAPDIGCYEKDQESLSCGFTAPVAAALNGVGVVFTPTVYGAGSAEITCKWDFDDGGSEVVAALAPYTHAFATAKMHVVTLSVSRDGGSTWIASYTAPVPFVTAPGDIWVDETSAAPAFPYATEATAATDLYAVLGMLTNVTSAGATVIDGVTVHVKPGTYTGIGYPTIGSAVTIVGVGSRDAVVFDAEQKGRPFYLKHAGATLSGITVRNGKSVMTTPYGGNVSMDYGVVTNCVVADGRTSANDYSRGLNVWMSGGLVVDSEIKGGAYTEAWHPSTGLNVCMLGGRVVRCVISGARGCSTGNGSDAVNMQGGTIENCLLTDNKTTGGALFLNAATARAVNCTVVTNSSSGVLLYGHGIVCNNSSARVVNCAIYENGGTAKAEWGEKNAACFTNCAFSAEAAFTGANAAVKDLTDAAFRKYANGDYRPKSGGALVDAGTSWDDYLSYGAMSAADLLGNARVLHKLLDIGCYENQTSAATQVILR